MISQNLLETPSPLCYPAAVMSGKFKEAYERSCAAQCESHERLLKLMFEEFHVGQRVSWIHDYRGARQGGTVVELHDRYLQLKVRNDRTGTVRWLGAHIIE